MKYFIIFIYIGFITITCQDINKNITKDFLKEIQSKMQENNQKHNQINDQMIPQIQIEHEKRNQKRFGRKERDIDNNNYDNEEIYGQMEKQPHKRRRHYKENFQGFLILVLLAGLLFLCCRRARLIRRQRNEQTKAQLKEMVQKMVQEQFRKYQYQQFQNIQMPFNSNIQQCIGTPVQQVFTSNQPTRWIPIHQNQQIELHNQVQLPSWNPVNQKQQVELHNQAYPQI